MNTRMASGRTSSIKAMSTTPATIWPTNGALMPRSASHEHPSEAARLTRVVRAIDEAHAGLNAGSRTRYAAALC